MSTSESLTILPTSSPTTHYRRNEKPWYENQHKPSTIRTMDVIEGIMSEENLEYPDRSTVLVVISIPEGQEGQNHHMVAVSEGSPEVENAAEHGADKVIKKKIRLYER